MIPSSRIARVAVPIVLANVLLSSRTSAQLSTIPAGSRIRVSAPSISGRALTGSLVAPIGNTVSVMVPARELMTFAIPTDAVRRLDLGLGESRGAGARRGAKIGLVGGAVVSAAYVLVTAVTAENDDDFFFPSRSEKIGASVLIGGAMTGFSTVVGATVGAIVRSERWKRVYP